VPRPLHLLVLEDRYLPGTYAITDIGTNITPIALNNNGAVGGDIVNSSSGQAVGFLYQNGTLSDLNGRTGTVFPSGLNDSNQVVGADSNGPVLWTNGDVTALPIAGVIADNGTIAGGYEPAEVDVNGSVTALPVPGGGTFSLADAISVNGQYVSGFGPDIFNGSGESAPYLWNLVTPAASFPSRRRRPCRPRPGGLGRQPGSVLPDRTPTLQQPRCQVL
jgi:hypothetical protein